MKKYFVLTIIAASSFAQAAGWTQLKSVCYSTLNTGHYNDMTQEMKQCARVVSALNLMQTENFVIQSKCEEAREGSGSSQCWGAKLSTKVLAIEE